MADQDRRDGDDEQRRSRDRAGEEVRSSFGRDETRSRRGNDERQDHFPYGGDRERGWQEQSQREGGSRREQHPHHSDDREQDRSPQQSGQYGRGGQYGSSTYDRGSYSSGTQDRREDERAWSRGRGEGEPQAGQGERWGGAREGEPRHGEDRGNQSYREPGRSSFGGYGTGGAGSGRNESGSYGGGGDHRTPFGGSGGGEYRSGGGSQGGGMGGWGRPSYSGRGPKDYKRSDDRIREEISDRLTDDHHVDASEVSVQVQNGEVTLTGMVPDREQKRRAEDLAEAVSGVTDVTNHLRVNKGWQSRSEGTTPQSSSSASAGPSPGSGDQAQPGAKAPAKDKG
jgi:hypothetical protein